MAIGYDPFTDPNVINSAYKMPSSNVSVFANGQYNNAPIGPSKPGYVQGYANAYPTGTVPTSRYPSSQVLGLDTSSTSGGSVPTQQEPQAPQALQGPSEQDLMNQKINDAYGGYISSLDQQLNDLGGYQNTQNQYINDQTALSQNQLDINKTNSLNQLQGYEGEATANKAKTLRDVQQDLVNALQAGQVYLGGMGAGSSSAVGRMSGALAKGANQRYTDVNNQFAGIKNDINMQRSNLQGVYDTEASKLTQWKNEQINSIATWVQQQRSALTDRKGQVDMQKNLEVIQMAQDALAQVDQQQTTFNQQLQQWAADKSTSLDQYVQQMQGMGQYNVPGYTYDPMSGNFQSNARGDIVRKYYGSGNDEERQV